MLVAFAAAVVLGATATFKDTLYYPHVEVSLPYDVNINILFNGRGDEKRCKTLAENVANSILTVCPTCQVKQKECLDALEPQQRSVLSAEPLDVPSARLPGGVVTYHASNTEIALAACIESGRQAKISGRPGNVICYPPNSARPIPAGYYKEPGMTDRLLKNPPLLQVIAVIVLGLVLVLAVRRTPRADQPGLRAIADLPRYVKQLLMVLADIVLLPLALLSAIALRNAPNFPDLMPLWWLLISLPVLTIPVFTKLGLYRAVIRYFEIDAAWSIFWGVTLSTAILAALSWLWEMTTISWLVYLTYWLIALILVGTSRLTARYLLHKLTHQSETNRTPIAIFGAGKAGVQLARSLLMGNDYIPVAFFDDATQFHGTIISGVRVFAPTDLADVIERLKIKQVFLAAPAITRRRRQELFAAMEQLNLTVKTIPSLSELLSGQAHIEDIREISIEELLARDPVIPDERLLTVCNQSKSVMVTGAGGSIGSELCRQVLQLAPMRLVLYEFSEFFLYQIEQELQAIVAGLPQRVDIIPVLGSVCDKHKVEAVMRAYGVQTLYHAAAYKHVPIVEHNVIDGLRNNAIGTWITAAAAQAAGVETFILISTDKAVRPTNVMGASKRFAELVLQGLSSLNGKTRFCMVRFGNVLGSSGSVVPLFDRQIKAGGPVTVTHPDVTRYFMTIPEAAQLVIQAGAMGQGGDVFVLDMGTPVNVLRLAERMIRLSGYTIRSSDKPDGDIEIVFTGLRPGEKLHEELLINGKISGTRHPLIMRTEEDCLPWPEILERLRALENACETYDYAQIFQLLKNTIEGYVPGSRTFDLLQPKS